MKTGVNHAYLRLHFLKNGSRPGKVGTTGVQNFARGTFGNNKISGHSQHFSVKCVNFLLKITKFEKSSKNNWKSIIGTPDHLVRNTFLFIHQIKLLSM